MSYAPPPPTPSMFGSLKANLPFFVMIIAAGFIGGVSVHFLTNYVTTQAQLAAKAEVERLLLLSVEQPARARAPASTSTRKPEPPVFTTII